MGKIDTWQNQIDRLQERLVELEGFEAPGVGTDLTEGRIEHIKKQIQRYQDMIDRYEGDDA